MVFQTNRYFIDGVDLWTAFGVGIESGSDDFLKMPERKESTSHNWQDEHGIDVDLSRVFFEPKEIELKCHIIAHTEVEFWDKYMGFLAVLAKPGVRRMFVTELNRDFYVYYKSCNVYNRFTRIRQGNLIACKFNLKLIEKIPTLSTQTFVVDEIGRFLIT